MSEAKQKLSEKPGSPLVRCHECSKAAPCGANLGTDHEQIPTQTSEGLAGRILEMAGETTGVICVALDVEVAGAAVAVSRRGKAPRYFGKSGREEILGTMKSLADLGNQVVCVQEACGFGYCFHRELQAAGVESLVVAPEPLNGRRLVADRSVFIGALLLHSLITERPKAQRTLARTGLRRTIGRCGLRRATSSNPALSYMDLAPNHI